MTISTALAFLGAGDVYFTPYLTGGLMGKTVKTGNTTKLSLKTKSKRKDQISKRRDDYGSNLESVVLSEPTEISLTLETLNLANLRYCFMGENATYAQTAATVTGEAFTAKLDGWVQLAKENLGPTVVVHNGGSTLVEGADYEINRRMGMISILGTSAVAEDAPLTIDYAALAFTGAAIRGAVNPQIRVLITLDGKNMVDDSIGILRVWQAVVSPTGEFDWFKDDLNKIELGGQLNVPTGHAEAFKYYTR